MPQRIFGSWEFVGTNNTPETHFVRPDFIEKGWDWVRDEVIGREILDKGLDVMGWLPFGFRDRFGTMPHRGYQQAKQSGNPELRRWALTFSRSWREARDKWPDAEIVAYNGSFRNDAKYEQRKTETRGFDNLFKEIGGAIRPYVNAGISYADDALGAAEPGSAAAGLAKMMKGLFENDRDERTRYYIEPMPAKGNGLHDQNIVVIDSFWRRMGRQQAEQAEQGKPDIHWAEPLGNLTGEICRIVRAGPEHPNYVTDREGYNKWVITTLEEIAADGHSAVLSTHALSAETWKEIKRIDAAMRASGGGA